MFVPLIILSALFLFSAYNTPVGEMRLFCNQNGDFTILIVSDPQCDTKAQWREAAAELETLIVRSGPDFVLINGDMNSKNKIDADMWDLFITPVTSRNLFWSTTNGNHDPYTDEHYKMYKSYARCLNSRVSKGDPNFEAQRPMNYVIPVYSFDGKRVVFAIYALDSGTSNIHGYEGLTSRQIAWYTQQSNTLKRQNGGRAVISLMCLHTPLTQTIDMFYSNAAAAAATPKISGGLYPVYGITRQSDAAITDYHCENGTFVSKSFIHTTAPQNDRGIFKKVLELGDVKAFVFGHEHKTNIVGSYKGVLLSFAGKLSTGCYSDTLCRGGRVIKFNHYCPQKFTSQWIGALPTSPDQPAVYSDGTIAK